MAGAGEWATPERLAEPAAAGERVFDAYAAFASGEDDSTIRAYDAFASGEDDSTIRAHGIVDDDYALVYARNLRDLLACHAAPLDGAVLDVGCGIGTLTHAIRAAGGPRLECHGIELSESAIGVARSRYPDCAFHVGSADDLGAFDDGFFSLIHAREFYPFTRSRDAGLHARMLAAFALKLKPGGSVVAVQIIDRVGLRDSFAVLAGRVRELGFKRAKRRVMVPIRAYRRLGRAAYGPALYSLIAASGAALDAVRPGLVSTVYMFAKPAAGLPPISGPALKLEFGAG